MTRCYLTLSPALTATTYALSSSSPFYWCRLPSYNKPQEYRHRDKLINANRSISNQLAFKVVEQVLDISNEFILGFKAVIEFKS